MTVIDAYEDIIDAYEDACRTVRLWQNRGVTLAMVAAELGLRGHCSWQRVIEYIVAELLAANAGAPRRAA